MLKRTQPFLLMALGLALALLLNWWFDPDRRDSVTADIPAGGPAPVDVRDGRRSRVFETDSPLDANTEASEAEALSTRTDVVIPSDGAPISSDGVVAEPEHGARVPLQSQGEGAAAADTLAPDATPNAETQPPLAWCFLTSRGHDIASDSSTVWNGSRSVVIAKNDSDGRAPERRGGVDTLWQVVAAAAYRGKRIQVLVHVNTRAGVQLFLDTATQRQVAERHAFQTAPVARKRFAGSDAGWAELWVVGDVPPTADFVYYGVSYMGAGPLWVDDVRVIPIGGELPPTVAGPDDAPVFFPDDPRPALPTPTNLDFEVASDPGADRPCRVAL